MQILQMHFLGHVISADGIAVDPEQLKSFLGLASEAGGCAYFLLQYLVSLIKDLCRTSPALSVDSEFEFAEFLQDRETYDRIVVQG